MKTNFLYLILIIILSHRPVLGQNPDSNQQHVLDSLKKELRKANHDTMKIRLRFWIADKENVRRVGFWDSVRTEAYKNKMKIYEARSYKKLGYAYRFISNSAKAMESFDSSYKLFREIGSRPNQLALLRLLVEQSTYESNFKKALDYSYMGLRISELGNNKKSAAGFYSELGRVYFFLREYQKALEFHLKALTVFQHLKIDREIVSLLSDIGGDYSQLKNESKSIYYYMQTAKYVTEFPGTYDEIEILNVLGTAYLMKHQYDSSEYYYKKAYRCSETLNDIERKANTMKLLAGANFAKRNYAKAKEYALLSLEFCKTSKFTALLPELTDILKKIYLKENNYKGALDAYELFISSRDSLSNEENRKLAMEKEFGFAIEKKENENKLLAQQNQIQVMELRQNNYFLIGMSTILVLVFIIGYLFIRQNRIRNEQQSSLLEQKLLRSQMNPHFIFNSLQAIQNFILKRDEKEAIKYLSSFAAVTRNVLENSRMEVIPLKKEISLLENYLHLQKLRFKNRFDYEIVVDKSIDLETLKIPPMLSQPFIENAVEHGFHNIEGEGKITVSYIIKNNVLEMEIIDNGTGMKSSYSENKKHESLALEITKERIALMGKKIKEKVIFSISEAFPSENGRKGVKVNFCLPLTLLS